MKRLMVACGLLFSFFTPSLHVHGYGQGKKTRCLSTPTFGKKVEKFIRSCQLEVKNGLVDVLLEAALTRNSKDQSRRPHILDAFTDQLFDDDQNYHSPTLPYSTGHHLNPYGIDQIVPTHYAPNHQQYTPVDPHYIQPDPYHKGLVPINPYHQHGPPIDPHHAHLAPGSDPRYTPFFPQPQYGTQSVAHHHKPLVPHAKPPVYAYPVPQPNGYLPQPVGIYAPQPINPYPVPYGTHVPPFRPLPGPPSYHYPNAYQPQLPPGHPSFPFSDNPQPDSYHPQQQVPNFQKLPDNQLPLTSEVGTSKSTLSELINVVEARQELKSVLAPSKPTDPQDRSMAIDRLRFLNNQYDQYPPTSNTNYRIKRSLFGYFKNHEDDEEEEFLPTVISHEDRWVAGCLMQCIYRKNNAVDENGFPTLEGLTDLYTAGIKEQPMFVHVLRATVRCLRTSGAKHGIYSKKFDQSTKNGLTCDVSFDVFDCVSDSITDYCTS